MNEVEARAILAGQIGELRQRPYDHWRSWVRQGRVETLEVAGGSAAVYQIEVRAHWDDAGKQNIRVLVALNDGGWRAFLPMCKDFIISPDGSFVGEPGEQHR